MIKEKYEELKELENDFRKLTGKANGLFTQMRAELSSLHDPSNQVVPSLLKIGAQSTSAKVLQSHRDRDHGR